MWEANVKIWVNIEDIENTEKSFLRLLIHGTSLAIQWLRLRASNAEIVGLIPGQGTKIPQAMHWGQKNQTKQTNMNINSL